METLKDIAPFSGLIAMGLLMAFGVLLAMSEGRARRKRATQLHVVMEGNLLAVEYGHHTEHWTTRSGSMVHTTHHHARRVEHTFIRFDDGRTCVLGGRHDMPYPWGTRLVVEEDGNGHRRIRRAQEA